MAQYVNEQKTPLWIRHVVIPGVTNDPADVDMLAAAIAMLPTVQKVELLPYHEMGAFKWKQLGLTYELEHIKPPDGEQLADVQQQLQARLNIPVIL